MNLLKDFPDRTTLLQWYEDAGTTIARPLKVNNHIHSPYSFSAFKDIPHAVSMAVKEKISVLGINDFFVRDGYEEFAQECQKQQVFPLFNIEFIALSKADQANNTRVNDPNNPGRTYLSGKGLNFPATLSAENEAKLEALINESQQQVTEMINKLNDHIAETGYDLKLSMDEITGRFAKKLVRERHIATALRIRAAESFPEEADQKSFFTTLFGGSSPENSLQQTAAFENEIRGKLLKTGGAAFVPEDEKAFLEVTEIRDVILDMGGIPTYPLLLDDKNGNYTDFEAPKEKLLETLRSRNIFSIEMIPNRNALEHLKTYVEYFYANGFVVSFGTEHNTPELPELTVKCRGGVDLDDSLMSIGYNGAAVVAAHQYLRAKGENGYVCAHGEASNTQRGEFEQLGKAVIHYYLNECTQK
jgi:hypothetical protein